ncbi:MAG: cytochrome C [SAR86 cluster bacterium]|uniref:Cytochrome C n=1 Tax=SAR86 cluster bacterium TaxID=2030880 RepID=A0A2A4MV88_9GAMM|nr:MAG: cytochrome C [SAR86 cluster bacterium]
MKQQTLLLSLCFICLMPITFSAEPFSPYVDANGEIRFPENFRRNMTHLGSWFVPSGEASGFHDVYTQRENIAYFRVNGRFPDGAVLVKELRASQAGDYTTGQGVHHATTEVKQWFVMIKDSQNRFANNPVWGDGWGWALFKPDNPSLNVAQDYKSECLNCHIPAKSQDWIYTQAYPLLAREP